MPFHSDDTLYARLGGYDAIALVADELLSRLIDDPQLGRFWQHRGSDRIQLEKQLLIDFLCSSAGGPLYYTGRDMELSHRGMDISTSDWEIFLGHATDVLAKFNAPAKETAELLAFIETQKADIVES